MDRSCGSISKIPPRVAFYITLTIFPVWPCEHVPGASPVSMCATHPLYLYIYLYSTTASKQCLTRLLMNLVIKAVRLKGLRAPRFIDDLRCLFALL